MTSNEFRSRVELATGAPLCAAQIATLQVNVGLCCNQQYRHCHLGASPEATESMAWETMLDVASAVRQASCGVVDITGGAPELNRHIRPFVELLRSRGVAVQLRTNLTAFGLNGCGDLPMFFRDHGVRLVASLPCYQEENVAAQRGDGVYEGSIAGLQRLNELGYGIQPDLPLSLVFNPTGPFLPPLQAELEADYREELKQRFGIVFTHLLTITNMPLGRFHEGLAKRGEAPAYESLLRDSFNPATVDGLMCRHQVSVRWDGMLFDCDFNLALGLPVTERLARHVEEFDAGGLASREIVTGPHCFGCTAGCGSSCAGALV